MRILIYRTLNSVVITLEDISKGKQIEEKLRYSEERYRLVLKNSPLIVAHIDQDLRYTWIHNPHPDFKVDDYLGKRDDEINLEFTSCADGLKYTCANSYYSTKT